MTMILNPRLLRDSNTAYQLGHLE